MRTARRRLPLVIACVVAMLVLAPAVTQAAARLVVSSATEPPDRIRAGGQWRAGITVTNEGSSTSRRQRMTFYLVRGTKLTAADLKRTLSSKVRIPALRPGRAKSTRATLKVPKGTGNASFYLLSCLGKATKGAIRTNCRLSGQLVLIGPIPLDTSEVGPTGPAGPKGDKGDPAILRVNRASLDTGFANFNEGETEPHPVTGTPPNTDVATEGSTQTVALAQVGPLTFTGLCREGMPWEGFGNQTGRDEAKVLVTHNASGATMAFRGIMGSRANVPAGRGKAGINSALGGEGQHQILATFRQRDEGFSTKEDTPPPGAQDSGVSGFQAGSIYIALSNGWEVMFSGYAGLDVNGVGTPDNLQSDYPDDDFYDKEGEDDRCVFGGFVTVANVGS